MISDNKMFGTKILQRLNSAAHEVAHKVVQDVLVKAKKKC
jgi:hypothetical protein